LHIKPGDRVLVVVRGSMAILLPKPENHADAILGIARDLYRENHLGMEGES
jgi:hypothetical protein